MSQELLQRRKQLLEQKKALLQQEQDTNDENYWLDVLKNVPASAASVASGAVGGITDFITGRVADIGHELREIAQDSPIASDESKEWLQYEPRRPEGRGFMNAAGQIAKGYADRYMGPQIKETFREDPVGTAMDVALPLQVASGGALLGGKVLKHAAGPLSAMKSESLSEVYKLRGKEGRAFRRAKARKEDKLDLAREARSTHAGIRRKLDEDFLKGREEIMSRFSNARVDINQAERIVRKGLNKIEDALKGEPLVTDAKRSLEELTQLRDVKGLAHRARAPQNEELWRQFQSKAASDTYTIGGLNQLQKDIKSLFRQNNYPETQKALRELNTDLDGFYAKTIPGYKKLSREYKSRSEWLAQREKELKLGADDKLTDTGKSLHAAHSLGRDPFNMKAAYLDELDKAAPGKNIKARTLGQNFDKDIPQKFNIGGDYRAIFSILYPFTTPLAGAIASRGGQLIAPQLSLAARLAQGGHQYGTKVGGAKPTFDYEPHRAPVY